MPEYAVCDERDMAEQRFDLDHVMVIFDAAHDRAAFYEAARDWPGLSWVLFRHPQPDEWVWVAQHIDGTRLRDEAPMLSET